MDIQRTSARHKLRMALLLLLAFHFNQCPGSSQNSPWLSNKESVAVALFEGAWVIGLRNVLYPFKIGAMKRRKASWISVSNCVFFLCHEKSASIGVISTAEPSCVFLWTGVEIGRRKAELKGVFYSSTGVVCLNIKKANHQGMLRQRWIKNECNLQRLEPKTSMGFDFQLYHSQ